MLGGAPVVGCMLLSSVPSCVCTLSVPLSVCRVLLCCSVEEAGDPPDHQRRFFGVPAGIPNVIAPSRSCCVCLRCNRNAVVFFVFCGGALAEKKRTANARVRGEREPKTKNGPKRIHP